MHQTRSHFRVSFFCQHVVVWMALTILTSALAPGFSWAEQPPPPPTRAPDEMIASKIEDVIGVWEQRFMAGVAYIQYESDGTWKLADTVTDLETRPLVTGTCWFEGTVFTIQDTYGQGTYEVSVTKEGDRRVDLRCAQPRPALSRPLTSRPLTGYIILDAKCSCIYKAIKTLLKSRHKISSSFK